MERFQNRLSQADPGFRHLIGRVPLQATPPLPPEWLRCEMTERYEVLRHAPVLDGATVLEVGSGAHAMSTVPLAWRAGKTGRVIAVERARWSQFRPIVAAVGLEDRVHPVAGDARRLPLRTNSADFAVCLHGVRSLRGEDNIVRVLREMLRVSPRVFVAESLPIARTGGQRAHLAMYNLREDVFSATNGIRDDLPYLPLDQLEALVVTAGGVVEQTESLEVDLPHFLAYFPRSLAAAVPNEDQRATLLKRWDEAEAMRQRYGEDHPPVGIVTASRA